MDRETDNVSWLRVFPCEPSDLKTARHTDDEKAEYKTAFEEETRCIPRSDTSKMTKAAERLAARHQIIDWKWYWFVDRRDVDEWWEKITRAVVSGQIRATVVAVTILCSSGEHSDNVIAVYNDDFRKHDEVFGLKDAIRRAGVQKNMFYKPRYYTVLDVTTYGLRSQMYIDRLRGM